MRAPPSGISDDRSEANADNSIRASYKLIARECIGAGLDPADADDLAQDLWEWLIRHGVAPAAVASPWMMGVVRNYIRRFRRRTHSHDTRESDPLDAAPELDSEPLRCIESDEFLDRVAAVLPGRERKLLVLIRRGYSLPEASRILGIPDGSRAYYNGRLIAYGRREMSRRGFLPRGEITRSE